MIPFPFTVAVMAWQKFELTCQGQVIALCRNGKKGVPKKARIQDGPVGCWGLFLAEACGPDIWPVCHPSQVKSVLRDFGLRARCCGYGEKAHVTPGAILIFDGITCSDEEMGFCFPDVPDRLHRFLSFPLSNHPSLGTPGSPFPAFPGTAWPSSWTMRTWQSCFLMSVYSPFRQNVQGDLKMY